MDIELYKQQLDQIDLALSSCSEGPEKIELESLKKSILELLELTAESDNEKKPSTSSTVEDEYALFMSEMEKEGVLTKNDEQNDNLLKPMFKNIDSLEGKKCRAPHEHHWGGFAYHNAMICSVVSNTDTNSNDIMVRVLFTNPTHREMLPCPYYFDNDCKFSEEKCRFSHGETVLLSTLQEYVEPNFEDLKIGSSVLAKQSDNLWYRGLIRRIFDDTKKCLVKFESNQKDLEVLLEHIFPLHDEDSNSNDGSSSDSDSERDEEDIINMSLLITNSQALGEWEKYTKGIGSKLMQKMGYIVGTGLGRHAEGRIDPVNAVILPAGKSLDHCMMLRENAGGDKDLFSVERKMKRLQRKQQIQNEKAYNREKNKVDVFNFLNKTLSTSDISSNDIKDNKKSHREVIKKESSRNLNVASLQIDENIRRVERDIDQIKESLSRHVDIRSTINKSLKEKLAVKKSELKQLHSQALNIKNEQCNRSDKKKLTIF